MGLRDFFKKGTEEPAKPATNISPKPVQTPPGTQPISKGTDIPQPQQTTATTTSNQDVYTVASGDSLSKIAKKLYGNANDWKKIYNANKDKIGDNPDLIRPGQRFVIPRD